MGCNKCYNHTCNGNCKTDITRQIRIENNSIGKDGESAYEAYVRNGGTLSYSEWALLIESDIYKIDNWV